MNPNIATTGLVPFVIGSVETFQLQGVLDGIPWDFTGGTVTLYVLDPNGNTTTFSATISGTDAFVTYTIVAPAGNWTRAWLVVDAAGVTQKSRPIPFTVVAAP